MELWKGGLVVCLVCSGARPLHAQPRTAGRGGFAAEMYAGWLEGRHSGGALLGGSLRLGYRWLSCGLSLQGATILLGSMGSASALGGISARSSRLRLDVLAEVGVNGYTQVGGNFLSEDPGTGGVLPFAGGRAAALVRVVERASSGVEVWVGPSLGYAHDLRSVTHSYSYERDDWLFGGAPPTREFRTVTLGQTSYSGSLLISTTLPL